MTAVQAVEKLNAAIALLEEIKTDRPIYIEPGDALDHLYQLLGKLKIKAFDELTK